MARLLTLMLLLFFNTSFGQTGNKRDCKIEFYLLKSRKSNLDTSIKLRPGFFSVDITDLVDTAFIKDCEILSFTFRTEATKFMDSIFTIKSLRFELASALANRINNLDIPVMYGRQFALVINGNIVYSGYFWNRDSSWGLGVGNIAFAYDTSIDIFLKELPDNPILLDCLNKTN